MHRLEPVVFHDDWGSSVAIASVQGRPIPSEQPESELWVGAHEDGPAGVAGVAGVAGGTTLLDLIASDPERLLGREALEAFGPRLPFLLKVLAPARAISIQVHPSAEQAAVHRTGGARDVYVDDWAKPELLVAVAPFEVFVGMRDFEEIELLAGFLDVPRFTDLVTAAREAADPTHAMLAAVLEVPDADRRDFVREIVAAAVRVEVVEDEIGAACAAMVDIAEDHPDDIGLVVLLLMLHRVLQPGEYIDVPAGVLHSYVRGIGVEVLANSDNVVRAGLTTKPVNVPELLRIVDPSARGAAGRPETVRPRVEFFPSQSDRFALHRIRGLGEEDLPGTGRPRIVFCLRGQVSVDTGAEVIELARAESVYLGADEGEARLRGNGHVFIVTTP